jgi:hypothetical protein
MMAEETSVLARCPCGKVPKEISTYDVGQGWKYVFAVPDCCGEWMIEFRGNYKDPSSDDAELNKLAANAWNQAPRSEWLK